MALDFGDIEKLTQSQIDAETWEAGDEVYNLTTGTTQVYNGTIWEDVALGSGGSYTIFPIWAEENGGLANGAREFSFGNGATGAINIVVPFDCEVFAFSYDAETGSGTASFNIMVDDVSAYTTTPLAGLKAFETISSPLTITAGQCIGFQTNTISATLTDVRVCAWVRINTSAITTGVIGDLLNVLSTPPVTDQVLAWNGSAWAPKTIPTAGTPIDMSIVAINSVGFNSTTVSPVPGMSTTVTLTAAGIVKGTFHHSIVRATGTNSIVNFSIVINGFSGSTYTETVSTFNDTGSAFSFASLPAGTYTVSVEASTTTAITINSAALEAMAVDGA